MVALVLGMQGIRLLAGVVGVRYTDYALVWDKVPSIDVQYQRLLDLFTVLMLSDRDIYADLRWDRTLSSQVPEGLVFSRIGATIVESDYRLKEKIHEILSDLTDEQVLAFWQDVIGGKEKLPSLVNVKVEFAPGEVFVLSNGLLIRDANLQVLVGSDNERLNELLSSRLEQEIKSSEDFSHLRELSKIILLGQKLKELALLKGRKMRFSSFFRRYKLLGLTGNDEEILTLVGKYLLLKRNPVKIHLRGYEIKISGTIDFSGILPQIKEKEIDITVEEAIKKLEMFGIGLPPRIVPSRLPVESIIKDWQREVDLEPFWKILSILRRSRSQSLVSCAYGFLNLRPVKLGFDIIGRYFVDEARVIFSDLGLPDGALDSLPSNQPIKILAKFDPDSVTRSELADKLYGFIKLGYLVFIPGMKDGWVVGCRLNEDSRLFFSSLFSDNQVYLKYVPMEYRRDFENAVKRVKIEYMDPFKQEVKLLELVATYHVILDHRIQNPWPFICFSIRDLAGIDPFSGLAISLQGNV